MHITIAYCVFII